MGLENPLSLLASDLAIDLGSANTRVVVRGQGLVLDEPSVLAIRHRGGTRDVVAVGAGAKEMLGRTPDTIRAVRPLQGGVIRDYDAAEVMLRYFIARAVGRQRFVKPRAMVCVPLGISEEQRRAVQECTRAAGAREVQIVSAPVAAAVGAGLPVGEPTGALICDLGAGSTQIAVLSMGGVVASQRVDRGGDALDQAIVEHLAQVHELEISERTAEVIKIELGMDAGGSRALAVTGRHRRGGLPRQVNLTGADGARALVPAAEAVLAALKRSFARTSPELAADILDSGIVLAGGGALLAGFDAWLGRATDLPVVVAERPLHAAVEGAERLLADPRLLDVS